MIVGGTRRVKRGFFGSVVLFSAPTSSNSRPAGPTNDSQKSKNRDRPTGKGWWDSEGAVSSIPFAEPIVRRALYLSPLLGSVLHLHQITFALSVLRSPQMVEAQKDLIAKTGYGVGDPMHDQAVLVGLAEPDPFGAL